MNFMDPGFDGWLNENEARANQIIEISKQKQRGDARKIEAAKMISFIPRLRRLVEHVRGGDKTIAPSEISSLVKKITDLRDRVDGRI
jgi:hypothetical protein